MKQQLCIFNIVVFVTFSEGVGGPRDCRDEMKAWEVLTFGGLDLNVLFFEYQDGMGPSQ